MSDLRTQTNIHRFKNSIYSEMFQQEIQNGPNGKIKNNNKDALISRFVEQTKENQEILTKTDTIEISGEDKLSRREFILYCTKPWLRPPRKVQAAATLQELEEASRKIKEENRCKLNSAGNEIAIRNDYREVCDYLNDVDKMIHSDEYSFGYFVHYEENAFNRQMIDKQIENIFDENGISILEDTKLIFTIDPYDYRITVNGVEDKALISIIENALNVGENGKNLYGHILLSMNGENNEQLSSEGEKKRQVHNSVQEKLGIDIRDCVQTETDFITPEGESVKELLHRYVDTSEELKYQPNKENFKNVYDGYINSVLGYSYTSGETQILSVHYTSTGLHDIGQERCYGTGRTNWINGLVDQYVHQQGKATFTSFL